MVDVPPPTEGGSGSGFETNKQITLSFEFPSAEDVGQLYSYRLNTSAAVLGTRRWQPFRGQEVAIGVQQEGSGMYICEAANASEKSVHSVTITVQGTDIHCKIYSGLAINRLKWKYRDFIRLYVLYFRC